MFGLVYFPLALLMSRTRAAFQSGQSSSIGVLPNTKFPTENAPNLPFDGVHPVRADCGWNFAAAGTTSPGYYSQPNFGSFNLGAGNIGQSNVGFNNIGFGNYGRDNVGRMNTGTANVGYMNDGTSNLGALNTGNNQIGDNNTPAAAANSLQCMGYNNTQCSGVIGSLTTQSTYSIGSQLQGSFLFGESNEGTGLVGTDNFDQFSVGFQNEGGQQASGGGNIGVLNTGMALLGYNNTGDTVIGQDNDGINSIGFMNVGNLQIGYNNTGTLLSALNIGFSQVGSGDIGVLNTANNNIGFAQTIDNQVGGTYIDTSAVPLADPIIFSPVDAPVPNVGTSYNSLSFINESAPQVTIVSFIYQLTAMYSVTLLFPAVLSVVDLGCPGDVIQVFNNGYPIMTTTALRTVANPTCLGLNDPDTALADPVYSRGFVTLPAGCHVLSFRVQSGGTALAFRLDYIKPEQPSECTAPIPPMKPFNDADLISDPPAFAQPLLNCTVAMNTTTIDNAMINTTSNSTMSNSSSVSTSGYKKARKPRHN